MAWSTITVEGGLFPPDLLDQIAEGQGDGQRLEDFGLERGRLSDEIQSAFSDAQSYWDSYQRRLDRTAEDQHTGLTRNAWMIPFFGLLGFREGDIVFQRSSTHVAGVDYAISHFAGSAEHAPPIHMVGSQYELHRRPQQGGRAPHSLVQEFLNRDEALWGIVTNGRKLRVLRDSQRMTRPTYLEFDLEGMITGSQYSEFALLYRIMHRTRFPRGSDDAHTCLLERWFQQGIEQGGRVREKLRNGVEAALERLGRRFIQHPDSAELRSELARGLLSAQDFERELLRLIYRLLFLMVAEERRLLFSGEPTDEQRIYERYYSVSQLRERAALPQMRNRESHRHSDLWQGLLTTFRLFRIEDLAQRLGLHALNGELFGESACRHLESARISNHDLLRAIDSLGRFDDETVRRRVNYAALDVEELGSVYESLLDFEPIVVEADPERPEHWDFQLGAGGGRKSSGSYYTPRELVQELIGSALVPVMEQRLKDAGRDPAKQEQALRSMTVIDPAAGSGHFLLAAARRVARELARVRTGEREPAPEAVRTAMRDVVPSCIYGVDKNPMAVDLCKVGLWIEGHEPGRPLSFLDHHIKHGDSLIGVYDIQVLQDGIPDGAYKALTGDDKAVAARVKALNKRHKQGEQSLRPVVEQRRDLASDYRDLREMPDDTPEAVRDKEALYLLLREDGLTARTACDLWTYAFFAPLTAESEALAPTSDDVRSQHRAQVNGDAMAASRGHPYFHWPLEFPDVFNDGGFDVVLGNPPWERTEMQEKEFFASSAPEISKARHKADRVRMIDELQFSDARLWRQYNSAAHNSDAERLFFRESGRFPLGGGGKVDQSTVFFEMATYSVNRSGRTGQVVPTGLVTNKTTSSLFASLITNSSLVSFFDFQNSLGLFPSIGANVRFGLITTTGARSQEQAEYSFLLAQPTELRDRSKRFSLARNDYVLLNPETRTPPVFTSDREARVAKGIYRRVPVFVSNENGDEVVSSAIDPNEETREKDFQAKDARWQAGALYMLDMGAQSGDFLDHPIGRSVRLYEGKLIQHYDHRWRTFDSEGKGRHLSEVEKSDPQTLAVPRFWLPSTFVEARLDGRWNRDWLLVWRNFARNTDPRTMFASVVPRSAISDNLVVLLPNASTVQCSALLANLNSFMGDYLVRQKVGGMNIRFNVVRQIPFISPAVFGRSCTWERRVNLGDWIADRVLELSYTAWDLQPFAQDLGYDGPPFKWDPERRFEIRCELDAAYFHLYEIERNDVDYIMSTFPIVQRKDIAAHGTYRTRDRILEIYDGMASGGWQSSLDPPVADPRAAHTID